mmetsp:Transcript_57328/g.68513  ORF Transcript_57328/g.68513 Transcript_57328/m.68513 type:complete len:88 (+) Transcript_57328:1698-1961(+)
MLLLFQQRMSLHVRVQTSPQQIFTNNKYHAASAKRTLSPTDVVLDVKQICTSNLIPDSTTMLFLYVAKNSPKNVATPIYFRQLCDSF